ncbi:MAG TPA: sigma-54 dependent transcriptional regulator [Vitreimonas sp.]|uniref:nitrogen assimilation response regulator NtrX n=1 Tax=Vitreimonas sp. TaxID=3069702 RepID=UPI002D59BA80|nr:sigma-54 dependent transcriptional regulator [Vitreimonas sp.]HYD87460.1 sigma-54 dependent transcriptional regulator [Vitreimonas sp.]
MAQDILIIDDEADIRDLISGILEDDGHQVRAARDSDEALDAFRRRKPSLVVLDVWLQGSRVDGLELLAMFKEIDPDMPVIVISGHGTIETAVTAIRNGAYDFIEKPFTADRLLLVVQRALETTRLKRENAELKARSAASDLLIGSSAVMAALRSSIERVAQTNSRVLISGPAGSGKELVARLLHERSPRVNGPFVVINAASIAPARMESEIFGEEGPDGRPRKIGVFEQAHSGTLFLDEVGDMPPETQSKILRVLVDQRFRRLDGTADVQVNVRVVSSTSRDLTGDIAAGRFREDLFHRLNVVPLRAPALAERREDIPELAGYFVGRLAGMSGVPARQIGEDALAALQAADWPGNVRQLRNVIERILILAGGDPGAPVTVDALPPEAWPSAGFSKHDGLQEVIGLPLRDARERFEREYLNVQITRFGGNISRTAAFIGMERSALHRKLKSLGVEAPGRGGAEAE